jgi:hypothetical protein
MKLYTKIKIVGFALLAVASVVLLILPSDFFDEGQSICLSVLLANKECYACGMTRGIQHLIHLEFSKAYEFNKLSFVAFPLLLFVLGTELKDLIKEVKEQQ